MELREIEIFLTLAEELHFGRTAERLHVSPARISQAIKKQERSVGADLFERTSRTVKLTALGEQLRDDLRPLYRGLHDSVARVRVAAQSKAAVLTVGTVNFNAYELRAFWNAFKARYPQWSVRIRHNGFTDPYGALRDGRVDAVVTWLPVEEPDLVVGPVLFTETRSMIVPIEHELAERDTVSLEELGNYPALGAGPGVPEYWENEYVPFYTPSGRPVEKVLVTTGQEETMAAVGHDGVIHSRGAHVSRYTNRPDIVSIPIHDATPLYWVLVWRADRENAGIRGLAEVVRELGTATL
ncbi:LysR family transcriptional regulator [Nocardia yunnanensis]|uniref:LysR family transcriptional regulator n=1 Tax=Nocardia yunnanensis TaxID=2382165 RepID=A0A386Z8A2_9NOCA|nr:LysR family transcriptional regulator [Nocardia yunnanensis]AYF72815.1 LysR family transcriptional regulator [Nocardia yunnanensis]